MAVSSYPATTKQPRGLASGGRHHRSAASEPVPDDRLDPVGRLGAEFRRFAPDDVGIPAELDPTSDRIIEFLAESYDVPINAVFFRHFADGGHEYLARTWLLDPHQVEDKAARPSRRKLRPWNGRDFYVILGRAEPGDPRWPIAHKYGFGNAVGGSWYRKPLRNLEPGHRVFAYVSGAGYVGIGRVTGKVIPPRDAEVEIEGRPQPLLDQPDVSAAWKQKAASEDPQVTEMVVSVKWLAARPVEQAFREKGLFNSRVATCKLRDTRAIQTVESAFGLNTQTR